MITQKIEIKNFKSIRNLSLQDCKRINLLIGPPNVGKSNIMEALSLFDLPFHATKKIFTDVLKPEMRVNRLPQLFPYGNSEEKISVETSSQKVIVGVDSKGMQPELTYSIEANGKTIFDLSFSPFDKVEMPEVLVYFYSKAVRYRTSNLSILRPPYGANLMQIISNNSKLRDSLRNILEQYGFQLVFDSSDGDFKAMKQDHDGNIFMVPYDALAESIKHLMFYKAAIVSNQDKTICFEEPEGNTFPPYIVNLADTIIGDTNRNQFFITTHSPVIINHLLENAAADLAVYKIGMKHGYTDAHRLTDEDLRKVIDYSIDLLFNIEAFPEEK